MSATIGSAVAGVNEAFRRCLSAARLRRFPSKHPRNASFLGRVELPIVLGMNIVCLLGSPSEPSRSAGLLDHARSLLEPHATRIDTIRVRDLPAEALLQARFDDPAIAAVRERIGRARLVLVATPIYKAAYSGLLKSLLDLLPQDGLRGKLVWPLATGGSAAHLLALEYALKPVLAALGARDIVDGVYATDRQIERLPDGRHRLDEATAARLERVVGELVERLAPQRTGARLPAALRWAL